MDPKPNAMRPTVSTESEDKKLSFWERYRKTITLFGGCLLLLAVGRACSSKQETAKKEQRAAHNQRDAEREQADKNDQINLLRAQLLEEQKRSEAESAQNAAINSVAPNPLTPAQQQRLGAVAANGGQVNGGPVYGPNPQAASGGFPATTEQSKPTSLVISYRQEEAAAVAEHAAGANSAVPQSPPKAPELTEDQQHGVNASSGEKYRIRQGTWIPCTEQLRLNGAFAGNINCLVSIPIYSPSGSHLLMPQGTVALGRIEEVASQGQQRLFVAFDSFIMPDGFTVTIKDAAGLDQIGQTGLRDKVDHHYAQIFGVSIGLAAISGLSQIGNYGNGTITPAGQYRAGVTQSMSEGSLRVLDRFSNVLPTFIVREGARNNIHLPMSLYLPDYSKHALKGDL